MDQITGSIAGVSSEDDFSRSFFFYSIHHVQRLHLQAFRNLQCDEAIVIRLNPLDQLIEFEVMTVHVHGFTLSRRQTSP